jgi:hypothetical protein
MFVDGRRHVGPSHGPATADFPNIRFAMLRWRRAQNVFFGHCLWAMTQCRRRRT